MPIPPSDETPADAWQKGQDVMSLFHCDYCDEDKPLTQRVNRAERAPFTLPPDYACEACDESQSECALEAMYETHYSGHESQAQRYLRTGQWED